MEAAFAKTVTYTDINTGQAKTGTLRQASIDLANIQLPQYITATASHAGTAIGMKTKAGDLGLSLGMGGGLRYSLDGKSGNVVNSIAIGSGGAKANRDNSIAIGGGATTDAAGVAQTSYTLSNGGIRLTGPVANMYCPVTWYHSVLPGMNVSLKMWHPVLSVQLLLMR